MKLDLGCGSHKKSGFLGIDIIDIPGVDIIRNLEKDVLPFDDATIEEVNASHFLEHMNNLIGICNEVHRVLVVGGLFTIEVPLFPDVGAMKDPTHVRYFVPESFDYFDLDWNYPLQPEYGIKKFKILSKKIDGTKPYRVIQVVMKKV